MRAIVEIATIIRRTALLFALVIVALGRQTAHAADLPTWRAAEPFNRLPWKERLPESGLSIKPIELSRWLDEGLSIERFVYYVAYPSSRYVCWPEMQACADLAHMSCDVATFGVAEVVHGRQVLAAKWRKTQECVPRRLAPFIENSMHDSITYRWGVRP